MPGNKILASRDDLTIYKTMDGEERFIGMKGLNSHYAYYRETSNREAEIFVTRTGITALQYDTVFTSLFALERQMIRRAESDPSLTYYLLEKLFYFPLLQGQESQLRPDYGKSIEKVLQLMETGHCYEKQMARGWPVDGLYAALQKYVNSVTQQFMLLSCCDRGKRNSVMRLSPIRGISPTISSSDSQSMEFGICPGRDEWN